MEITDVRFFEARGKGPVLAYATIILSNKFIIKGVKLLETEKSGRFIAMPAKKTNDEKHPYRDMCHPLDRDTREEFTNIIFEAYDEYLKEKK